MLLDVVYWKRAICYTIYIDGENVFKKGTTKNQLLQLQMKWLQENGETEKIEKIV